MFFKILHNEQILQPKVYNRITQLTLQQNEIKESLNISFVSPLIKSAMALNLQKINTDDRNYYAIICLEYNYIIGWSLLSETDIDNKYFMKIYVDKDFRNKGYGKQIINYTLSFCNKNNFSYYVMPWDKTSKKFFEKCNI